MNHLRIITSVALLLLLTYCTYQRSEKSRDRDYTSADLIGKWIQVSTDESSIDSNRKIEFLQFTNDSVVEIQIHDSTGVRKIYGEWENRFKKEIKPLGIKITIESNIKISYLDGNGYYILVLLLEEENNKTVMTASNYKFEKE